MTVHALFTPEEVSKMLKISSRTLADWRVNKKGPKYINMNGGSGAVRYPEDGLDDWMAEEFDRSVS